MQTIVALFLAALLALVIGAGLVMLLLSQISFEDNVNCVRFTYTKESPICHKKAITLVYTKVWGKPVTLVLWGHNHKVSYRCDLRFKILPLPILIGKNIVWPIRWFMVTGATGYMCF